MQKCDFMKLQSKHRCSPVNLLHILLNIFLRTSLMECFCVFILQFRFIPSIQVLKAIDEVGDILQLKYSRLNPPKPMVDYKMEKSKDE